MTRRERVIAALNRQPVDRVPVFMWFHPGTRERLAAILELAPRDVDEAMGNDIRQRWVNNNYAMEGIVHEREGDGHTDVWGIRWVKRYGFNQIVECPLTGASRDRVLAYRFPDDRIPELLDCMRPVLEDCRDFYIGCDVSPSVFELYCRLRGMEDAMADTAADPALAEEMLRRCADFTIRLSEPACDRFDLDWLWGGDDAGGQNAMMIGPNAWRKLVKPHLARTFEPGRARGITIAFHSCGAIRPIIPDLIEIGVQVLNPIQCNCPGMEPLELKAEFGARLAFMGGVDTQGVLPRGSAADVRRATRRLIDGMTADGGGYILAASHTIPPETPDENIFAMYHEAGLTREEIFDAASAIRARSAARRARGGS